MTLSILIRDPQSGLMGGAAATGSLCVGGWVLRGDARAGLSASQGASTSTLWGEAVLRDMGRGASAAQAVAQVTQADGGRDWRQLSALGLSGPGAVWTGAQNSDWKGHIARPDTLAAGNLLAGPQVLEALVQGSAPAPEAQADLAPDPQRQLGARLLGGLQSAAQAGGDRRGFRSAALLILGRSIAPLSLRIDYDEDPLAALARLFERATLGEYAAWTREVPSLDAPERRLSDPTLGAGPLQSEAK